MKMTKRTPVLVFLILNLIFPPVLLSQDRLAVLSLKSSGEIKPELGETIAVEIRNQIYKLGVYEVVSKDDIDEIAQHTATLQRIGCEKDNECLILFGNKLDSRFMVAGSIAKLKDKYHLALRMLDTKDDESGVKAHDSRTCACSDDELLKVGRVLAVQLIYNYHKGNPPKEDASTIVKDIYKTKIESLETVLNETMDRNIIDEDRGFLFRYKWWILGGLVLVAGGAAAAGGGGGGGDEQQPANTETGPVAVAW